MAPELSLSRQRGRSNSQAQRAIASSSAGAAYGNPGGQLAVRRQPYKSRDQPVDRDDDHGPCGRSSPPLPTTLPDAHMPCRARGPNGDRQTVASRPRSQPTPPYARRDGRCRPAAPPTAAAKVPALAGQVPSAHRGRRSRTPRNAVTARSQERFFASQVTARGPIWPHGTPRPCRSSNRLNPRELVKCREFRNSNHGRSRTRTWDLFLIRKTFCHLQSSQLGT